MPGHETDPILMTSFDDTNADPWDGVTFNAPTRLGCGGPPFGTAAGERVQHPVRRRAVNSPDVVLEDCTISDISTGAAITASTTRTRS